MSVVVAMLDSSPPHHPPCEKAADVVEPSVSEDVVVRNAVAAIAENQVEKATRIKTFEQTSKHQQRWTPEDDRVVLDAFRTNQPIKNTAEKLKRTEAAVRYQRSKLVLRALFAEADRMRKLIDVAFGPEVSTVYVLKTIDVLH